MFIVKFLIIFFSFQCFSNEIYTIEIDGSNLLNGEGTINDGKKLYSKNCSQCHGILVKVFTHQS